MLIPRSKNREDQLKKINKELRLRLGTANNIIKRNACSVMYKRTEQKIIMIQLTETEWEILSLMLSQKIIEIKKEEEIDD